eukprot:8056920-Ditylum_brightwellii.AAC.1
MKSKVHKMWVARILLPFADVVLMTVLSHHAQEGAEMWLKLHSRERMQKREGMMQWPVWVADNPETHPELQ